MAASTHIFRSHGAPFGQWRFKGCHFLAGLRVSLQAVDPRSNQNRNGAEEESYQHPPSTINVRFGKDLLSGGSAGSTT